MFLQDPGKLVWDAGRADDVDKFMDEMVAVAKFWDVVVLATRGPGASQQANHAHNIILEQLHYCYRLVHLVRMTPVQPDLALPDKHHGLLEKIFKLPADPTAL